MILSRTERDMMKDANGLHVKYPLFLSDFNETSIFVDGFSKKIIKHQISLKSGQWEPSSPMRTDRQTQTDMTKLTVAFRNLANAPKNTTKFLVPGFRS